MIRRALGRVETIEEERPGCQYVTVRVDGLEKAAPPAEAVPAVCFPPLTGSVIPGDRVILNTTAVDLGLGSGGFHFIMARLPHEGADHRGNRPQDRRGGSRSDAPGNGHIMKLRYTPLQLAVQVVDEEGSPHRAAMVDAEDLAGQPVVIGSLHSQLAPAVRGILLRRPATRIAYVMTDGAALPAAWSRTVAWLRSRGALCGCVTSGHCFGGDLEAVNVYSALLAARHVLRADVTVALMGPGVVGTHSRFGHSALEVGPLVNAVAALGGLPIVIPRLSAADARERHRGISHHTLTALGRLCLAEATVVLPPLPPELEERVHKQLEASGIGRRHRIWRSSWRPDEGPIGSEWQAWFRSMGRDYREDPVFFDAALCAGWYAASVLECPAAGPRPGNERA